MGTSDERKSNYAPESEVERSRLVVDADIGTLVRWQAAVERCRASVVSIHCINPFAFDAEIPSVCEGTGFVVDADRGLIATCRHVLTAGPVLIRVMFSNYEKVDAYPVHVDPVHDFAFIHFDPKSIEHITVVSLHLSPDLAKVGTEIRLVGNDCGEMFSILSGVISRIDRKAPKYKGGYTDFDTNYIQATLSASNGSSGSPVINVNGQVLGMQAGGFSTGATNYFLPLDRLLRSLRRIQSNTPISRGTIQCRWAMKSFDKCRSLGLTSEWEISIRRSCPSATGMLVAKTVLPEGPSDNNIKEGDLLIKVNGNFLIQFARLDDILDSSIGIKVDLLLCRGGKDVKVELRVEDLYKIIPDRFVSVAGSIFHNLSYHQAAKYRMPCKGVYISEAAGSFRPA